ncbi:MAG: TM2 domain-containing protein [Sphingobacteriales bacterium]
MDDYQRLYMAFPGISADEADLLQKATANLSEIQERHFFMMYEVKRKDPQTILLLTVIGTLGVAGLQRFATGEIILGFLYLFTFGFLWIGTILDLINYKNIAFQYNRKMAYESFEMAQISN